ncbi:MAG: Uma2 family endonuclease [Solirubrobacteraceae bacterium]
MATQVAAQDAAVHRFSVEDVVAMYAAGILDDDIRRELVDGVLIDMNPAGPRHAHVVERLTKHFVIGARDSFRVRVQDAVLTPDAGWRSPDLMVLAQGGRERLPDTALLIIEVASTSRARDAGKAAIYAEAGVAEYWIVDVDHDEVLVHREPAGTTYAAIERFVAGQQVAPLVEVPPVDLAALLAR